jgi:hypothetical protein
MVALPLISGCNTEKQDLAAQVDAYESNVLELSEALCRCPETFGFATTDECLMNQIDVDSACILDALDGNEAVGAEFYSCINAKLNDYIECLDGLACEPDWNVACMETYLDAVIEDCPHTPEEIIEMCIL